MPTDQPLYASQLGKVALFDGLSKRALERLSYTCTPIRRGADEVILREGDQGDSLYVILEGKVAMSKLNENDDQIVIAERVPGEIFGEMALLDGLPRSATVRAIEPSLFLVINRADFIHAIMETPEIALKIMATLCNRLREADRLRVLRLSVRQNVILLLLQMARSRGITDSKGRVRFANNLSGSEMGRRILATRESVSREMSKLRREGKIRTSGRDILIPDLNSLEAEIPL